MPFLTEITRREEFDAGHRVPSHEGKCANAHGHRYVIEVTVRGAVKPTRGASDDGMVVDFGCLKTAIEQCIIAPWDHGFLVYDRDVDMLDALSLLTARLALQGRRHRTVLLPFVPTAENLACEAFKRLDLALRNLSGAALELVKVRVYETPKSYADFSCVGGSRA